MRLRTRSTTSRRTDTQSLNCHLTKKIYSNYIYLNATLTLFCKTSSQTTHLGKKTHALFPHLSSVLANLKHVGVEPGYVFSLDTCTHFYHIKRQSSTSMTNFVAQCGVPKYSNVGQLLTKIIQCLPLRSISCGCFNFFLYCFGSFLDLE